METGISRNQIDAAMQRFLSRGGSIKKIDQVAGEPVMGKEYLLSEEMLEMVETEESDFFSQTSHLFPHKVGGSLSRLTKGGDNLCG